jgi:S-adenosylmethionine uptake transporter
LADGTNISANHRIRGLGLVSASFAVWALHYANIKWLAADYSVWQLLFVRSAIALLILSYIGRRHGTEALAASPNKLSLGLRGFLFFVSTLCFYTASRSLGLAEVTTVYAIAPVLIVVLAIPMLGEKIGGAHWLAVAIGLMGTIIAADPSGRITAAPALLALGSAVFWAFGAILTRQIALSESTANQMLATNIAFVLFAAFSLPWVWETPDPIGFMLMLALGIEVCLGQYFFYEGYRYAPASLLAPMEYTSVAWSCVLGYLIFSDIPALNVVLGALLVVGSGISLVALERRAAKQASFPDRSQ